ncbi:MAG: 3-oxoacyl-ACP reductase FabG [Syntrophomonas sp.]
MDKNIKTLENNICLITGAGRGIGAAIAREVAAQGAHVVVNYLSSETLARDLVAELRQMGVSSLSIKADVSREEEVEHMFCQVEKELGTVSMLINNAGVSLRGLVTETSVEQWEKVMGINLKGAFLCCRRALPEMIRHHFGRIVNIASVWGEHGASYESVYAASKGGLIALTKSLAQELAPSGITVNAISPGPIETDMLKNELDEEEKCFLAEQIPCGRLGRTEEVAAACGFLLTREAAYINGQVLSIDGGWKN